MSFSPSPEPVIAADTAQFFEDANLVSPIINGKRKISTALISSPSTIPSSSSRVSGASFSASHTRRESDEIEIPAELRSGETYEFLGFTYATAESLWQRYLTQPEGMDAGFFDFAAWHVEEPERADATAGEDDWIGCMTTMGIGPKLQTAILLPDFADLRCTASCKFWILDAMEMKWRALLALDGELRVTKARIESS